MSIRKISELPHVDVFIESSDETKNELEKRASSLIEVSHLSNLNQPYSFISKYTTYAEMLSSINHEIIGTDKDNKDVDFYTNATFKLPVDFESGVDISGNFNLSGSNVNSMKVNIGEIKLSSIASEISSNIINFYANNTLTISDKNANPNKIEIKKDDDKYKVILSAYNLETSENLDVGKTITTKNITINSGGSLCCYGTGYFTRDIYGCALCARWADLAEGYQSDFNYEPGTLVKFGGQEEITIADTEVNAVITTNPGMILGCNNNEGIIQNIALVGRVPVKVIGKVKKFDKLVLSNTPGVARIKQKDEKNTTIGIALQDSNVNDGEISLVESVMKLTY